MYLTYTCCMYLYMVSCAILIFQHIVWWSEIFFSQQPFSEGGHRIYSWRWARIPRIETGDWKTEDLVVAVGIWRSVQRFFLCWILYDQSFSWNSNRPILIPTHGLLDMASPAAFSCYESFLIQRFTPVPRWVLQSGVVGDVLNMCVCVFFFVLKSL